MSVTTQDVMDAIDDAGRALNLNELCTTLNAPRWRVFEATRDGIQNGDMRWWNEGAHNLVEVVALLPGAPASATLAESGTDDFTASWTAPASWGNGTGHKYHVVLLRDGAQVGAVESVGLSHVFAGAAATPGSYVARVTAETSYGISGPRNSAAVVIDEPDPPEPPEEPLQAEPVSEPLADPEPKPLATAKKATAKKATVKKAPAKKAASK